MTSPHPLGPGETAHVDPRTGLEVLSREECLRLLGAHSLGRLAIVVGGRPVMFPVNYALDGSTIVFRTDEGTKLHGTVPEQEVAFEIDDVDRLYHTGWSVLAVGVGREVTDEADVARLGHLHLGLWSPGPKSHWIRIHPHAITGRRIPQQHG